MASFLQSPLAYSPSTWGPRPWWEKKRPGPPSQSPFPGFPSITGGPTGIPPLPQPIRPPSPAQYGAAGRGAAFKVQGQRAAALQSALTGRALGYQSDQQAREAAMRMAPKLQINAQPNLQQQAPQPVQQQAPQVWQPQAGDEAGLPPRRPLPPWARRPIVPPPPGGEPPPPPVVPPPPGGEPPPPPLPPGTEPPPVSPPPGTIRPADQVSAISWWNQIRQAIANVVTNPQHALYNTLRNVQLPDLATGWTWNAQTQTPYWFSVQEFLNAVTAGSQQEVQHYLRQLNQFYEAGRAQEPPPPGAEPPPGTQPPQPYIPPSTPPPSDMQSAMQWWTNLRSYVWSVKSNPNHPQNALFANVDLPDPPQGWQWNPAAATYWFNLQDLQRAVDAGNAREVQDYLRRINQFLQAGTPLEPPPGLRPPERINVTMPPSRYGEPDDWASYTGGQTNAWADIRQFFRWWTSDNDVWGNWLSDVTPEQFVKVKEYLQWLGYTDLPAVQYIKMLGVDNLTAWSQALSAAWAYAVGVGQGRPPGGGGGGGPSREEQERQRRQQEQYERFVKRLHSRVPAGGVYGGASNPYVNWY